MSTILNFNKFIEYSTKYFKIKLLLDELKKQIEGHYQCSITDSRFFTFKRDNWTSKDILKVTKEYGLFFSHGGNNYYKFKLPIDIECSDKTFMVYNNALILLTEIGSKLRKMAGSNYPNTKIGGKSFDLELTSQYWGFKIRYLDSDDFSIEDIIFVEENTGAVFRDKDAFGVTFEWDINEI